MTDELALQQCRQCIESQLGWGSSDQWASPDFARLSDLIFEQTGVSLSVNTLKRLWGRLPYESKPSHTTLNTLAQFLGHADWRAFLVAESTGQVASDNVPTEPLPSARETPLAPRRSRPGLVWAAGLLMGIAIAWGLAFSLRSTKKPTGPERTYSFSNRIVAEGVPNSVIFSYDASQALTDCVAIQQSWDPKRRFIVDKRQHRVSSLYYYPGFFQAKLVVDGQVVAEQPLLLKTQGWLPLIEREPVPVYFKQSDARQKGYLGLTAAQITAMNVPMQPAPPWVSYYWVGDTERLPSTDFTLEATLRNEYATGSGACQHTQLRVLCEHNAITIPLSQPGCVSDLRLHVADQHVEGSKSDLSAFGCAVGEWVQVRCEVRKKVARIWLNGRLASQVTFKADAGVVVGLCCRFQGTGSLRNVRLSNAAGKAVLNGGI